MDREEAARIINECKDKGFKHTFYTLNEYHTALDIAIQALKREPCEDWYDVPSDEMTLGQARQAVKDLRKKLSEQIEQEPCEDVAKERYEDLCEYFGEAKSILNSREEFKKWLDRVKWHIRKAEELYEKYEYKQEPCEDAISRSEAIRIASGYCHWSNIPAELAKLPPVTQTPKNVNDVLDAIKADLQTLADDEWNQQVMASKGLEFAIEIIENYQMAIYERGFAAGKKEASTWIPVEDRLPEDGIYLVTVERTTGKPRVEIKSFAKDLNRVDDFSFRKHKCGWYDYDSEYGYWEDTKVIAWMPLPQPYKAESEE